MNKWGRELEVFAAFVARALGLHFDETRAAQLENALLQRAAETGFRDVGAYLAALPTRNLREEGRSIAVTLTVGETYFFRNQEQLRAFAEVVLPGLAASGIATARVLSAGCASGEEAYTLSMISHDTPGVRLEVSALDVNPAAIARARQGVYAPWSLRETSPELKSRHFQATGDKFRVRDEIRADVQFMEANLVDSDSRLWGPGTWDVIFCRNVLMYLLPETQRAIVSRFAACLKPGGFLFLGHAETLRGLSQEFHLRQSHETFYYQRHEHGAPVGAIRVGTADDSPARALALASELEESAPTWMEAIRNASEKITALSGAALESSALVGPRSENRAATRERERILDLVGHEKFGEALEALAGLPGAAENDPDTGLIKAALLVNAGSAGEAERVCASVLRADDLNSGAHYVMAQCREAAGDIGGAAEHGRAAVYLDPTFAMPRLHLGLLLRKSGDLTGAHDQFERALALLPSEDSSRLVLFGGGFGRESLMQLCRAEMKACAGRKP